MAPCNVGQQVPAVTHREQTIQELTVTSSRTIRLLKPSNLTVVISLKRVCAMSSRLTLPNAIQEDSDDPYQSKFRCVYIGTNVLTTASLRFCGTITIIFILCGFDATYGEEHMRLTHPS